MSSSVTQLHVLGNYMQTGGDFSAASGAHFNVDGTFTKAGNAPFLVLGGATFHVGNLSSGSVEASEFEVSGGSQVEIRDLTSSAGLRVLDANSSLHVVGNVVHSGLGYYSGLFVQNGAQFDVDGAFTQTGGPVRVLDANSSLHVVGNFVHHKLGDYDGFDVRDGAHFEVDGTFTETGNAPFLVLGGATFHVGNLSSGSVEASEFEVSGGSQVEIRDLTSSAGLRVLDANSSLHVVGNVVHSGLGYYSGLFVQNGAQFDVDGAFTQTGGPVRVLDANSSLHVVGNFVHHKQGDYDGFDIRDGAHFEVDGTFTETGNAPFLVIGGATFHVGNLSSGSVEASEFEVSGGSQVEIRDLTSSGGPVQVLDAGSSLHVVGNFVHHKQGDYDGFDIRDGAHFEVDGTFTETGNAPFLVIGGATFHVGNLSSGSVEASEFEVSGGSQVEIRDLTSSAGLRVLDANSSLHVVGNVVHSGLGYYSGLFVQNGAQFDVDGAFTQTGGPVRVLDANSSLHVVGNFVHHKQGDYDGFDIRDGAHFEVDGTFTETGNAPFLVIGGATFHVGNLSSGSVEASEFEVSGGSQVEIRDLTSSGGPVQVLDAGSSLHVVGNFVHHKQGDYDGFDIRDGAHFEVDGTFTETGNAPFLVLGGATLTTSSAGLGDDGLSLFQATLAGIGTKWMTNDLRIGSIGDSVHGNVRLEVSDGALLQVASTLTIGAGGQISGSGIIVPEVLVERGGQITGPFTVQTNVTNRGIVASVSYSGTVDIVGNYSQESGGALQIGVAGLTPGINSGLLRVTGAANIAGRLDVPLINGYLPQVNDTITFLQAPSVAGAFDSLSSPNLASAGGGLAIEIMPNQTQLRFVMPSSTNLFQGTTADSNWADAANWSAGIAPSSTNIVSMQNLAGMPQNVVVTQNQIVHNLSISGGASPLALSIQNGKSFSALTGVSISDQGIIDVDSGRLVTSVLDVGTDALLRIQNGGRFLAHSDSGLAATISTALGPPNSSANLLVTGAGSEFRADGLLVVGNSGNGTLTVENQGSVRSTLGHIGATTGSVGNVGIAGANSQWLVEDSLYIGGSASSLGGTGQVALTDHARLVIGNRLHLWSGGTFSLADGTAIASIGKGTPTNVPGTLQVLPDGVLSGRGVIQADTINGGTVRPGASPGILNIDGDYTQTADGSLEIEVGGLTPGTEHDQLIVSGTATLAGRLEVPIVNNFHPQVNDEIIFLTAGAVTGNFQTLVSPNLGSIDPNLALIEIASVANHNARLRFVAATHDVTFVTTSDEADWATAGTWSILGGPSNLNNVTIENLAGEPQRVDVTTDISLINRLDIQDDSDSIIVRVQNNKSLTATTDIVINSNAVVELGRPTVASDKGTLTSGSVVIDDGGRLSGNGTVKANLLVGTLNGLQQATLSPGFSIGHLDVQGNYQQAAIGTLLIDIESPTQFDTIDITGSATLDGTLQIDASSLTTIASGTLIPILTATSIIDTFDRVKTIGNNDLYFHATTIGSILYAEAEFRGDLNGDGVIGDSVDTELFAYGLMNRSTTKFFAKCRSVSAAACDILPQEGGDFSGNGRLDFDDIAGFQSQMAGRGMSSNALMAAIDRYLSPVPEPSSLLLAIAAFTTLLTVRRKPTSHNCV